MFRRKRRSRWVTARYWIHSRDPASDRLDARLAVTRVDPVVPPDDPDQRRIRVGCIEAISRIADRLSDSDLTQEQK